MTVECFENNLMMCHRILEINPYMFFIVDKSQSGKTYVDKKQLVMQKQDKNNNRESPKRRQHTISECKVSSFAAQH